MSGLTRRTFVKLLSAAILVAPTAARAAVDARQVLALTRALAYDRKLVERAGDELSITAVFVPGDAASEQMASEIVAIFEALAAQGVTVQELPIRIDKAEFAAELAESSDALFLCAGMEGQLEAVTTATRVQKTVSMSVSEEMVSNGVTLGVTDEGGKLRIMVNLPGAKAEGASFSSSLLQLAKVFR